MKLKHLYAAIAAVALSGSVSAAEIDFFKLEHRVSAASAPTVYFTSDISPQGLMATYEALGRVPSGSASAPLRARIFSTFSLILARFSLIPHRAALLF
ncbi:MAG TPA: hypothetical protein H9898_06530 [Candidatus Anaerobiospirillum stercoravium]|nr:hypothetical protein [Candidatus Anaerobiospirillum stercoravium]